MPEKSTTPDLVATRRAFELGSGRDWDAVLSFYGPETVWDLSPMGLGVYEGPAAIRRFYEDWTDSYEQFEMKLEEVLDLGNGVVFVVVSQAARPAGSTGSVRLRYAAVILWIDGVVVRLTNYTDIDEARAAAERLAKQRG